MAFGRKFHELKLRWDVRCTKHSCKVYECWNAGFWSLLIDGQGDLVSSISSSGTFDFKCKKQRCSGLESNNQCVFPGYNTVDVPSIRMFTLYIDMERALVCSVSFDFNLSKLFLSCRFALPSLRIAEGLWLRFFFILSVMCACDHLLAHVIECQFFDQLFGLRFKLPIKSATSLSSHCLCSCSILNIWDLRLTWALRFGRVQPWLSTWCL